MLRNSLGSSVEALVRSASRRQHGLLLLQHLSYALTMVLGGAILLLLLGTQILDWYWLVLLALAGVAVGAFRLRGRLLPHYQVAQILDRRLQLSDTISTAWFVLTTPLHSNLQRQLQLKQAEKLAAGVQPRTAFPFEGKRPWIICALLLVIACGLFGVRYFTYDRLIFKPTLIPLRLGSAIEQLQATFLLSSKREQKEYSQLKAPNVPVFRDNPANSKNDAPAKANGEEPGKEVPDSRDARQASSPRNSATHENTSKQEAPPGNSPSGDSASPTQNGPQQRSSRNNTGNKNGGEQAAKDSSTEQSLTSKLRDALSGLLAKMQGGSSSESSNQGANRQAHHSQNKKGAAPNKDQQSASENAAGKEAEASSLQAPQQASSTESASSSQSQGSSDSSGHRSSDTHSAAGRQDGSKDARAAEQLQAMGKLAEIIGKRSANVTGEMTVETPSGKQQLQTNYTYKSGRHSGIGSEIDHDDVPREDRQYVREYLKQVHSQPETR